MKKLLVRINFEHLGIHSGYDNVFRYLQNKQDSYESFFKNTSSLNKLKSLILYWANKNIPRTTLYNRSDFELEQNVISYASKKKSKLIHITHVENNYGLINKLKLKNKLNSVKIVGTLHQPLEWWEKEKQLQLLETLDAIVTLSLSEKKKFDKIFPNKVHFIPHAVDASYFTPTNKLRKTFRCLTIGNWMRDFRAVSNCIKKINKQNPNIEFDIVYNKPIEENEAYAELLHIKQVKFHTKITNQELLDLYHKATVLLLPLLNATANNAILESTACGLPILTSKIESLKSYTDSSFCFYFSKNEYAEMADWILEKYKNPESVSSISSLARSYSVNNLDIKIVAEQLEDLYKSLI